MDYRYLPNQSNVYSISSIASITMIHKWSTYCYKRSVNYLSCILGTGTSHGCFDTLVAIEIVLPLEQLNLSAALHLLLKSGAPTSANWADEGWNEASSVQRVRVTTSAAAELCYKTTWNMTSRAQIMIITRFSFGMHFLCNKKNFYINKR